MTGTEFTQRKIDIANAIKAGKSPVKLVKKYKVSLETVRNACKENGVLMPSVRSSIRQSLVASK